MATMFKILILDGTKSCNQSIRVPSDDILESLCMMRTGESDQLKTVLALYEQEIEQHLSQPTYQKLKTMAKKTYGSKDEDKKFPSQKRKN